MKHSRLIALLLLAALTAAGSPARFGQIQKRNTLRLLTPAGFCEVKVIERVTGRLLIENTRDSKACGPRKTRFSLVQSEVQSVERVRPAFATRYRHGLLHLLGITGLLVLTSTVAFATQSSLASLGVLIGGGAALIAWRPDPWRYEVIANRLDPPQP